MVQLHILIRAQQTVTIESNRQDSSSWFFNVVICIGPFSILNYERDNPIIRSTCILTDAIFLVSSMEHGCNCGKPFVNAGVFSVAKWKPTLSLIVKPLSVKLHLLATVYSGSHNFLWCVCH